MNRTIKLLILSDIFVLTGFGLIDPIFGIYLNSNLVDGTIFSAGLASAIFLVTKSIIQLPFSRHVDKFGDLNDIKWLIIGTCFIASVPFLYIFATNIYWIYIAQFLFGIGSGLAYPAWLGLWSTHLDRKKESFEWSLYSTIVGIGTAIAAAVGGAIAQYVGFIATFVIVGILSLLGCFILIHLRFQEKKNYCLYSA
jgi:MFS family permease